MRAGVAPLVVAGAALAVAGAALAASVPSLAPVGSTPLVLRGARFAPHETVRLTIFATRSATLRTTASARGRFVARAPFAVTACTLWAARAVGGRGGEAVYRARPTSCEAIGALVGTGIAGEVRRGPITPVCVAGKPCDAPASGAVVTVARGTAAVARTVADAFGRYAVSVEPGGYTVTVAGRAAAQRVLVSTGRVARADLHVDTGIR